MVKKKQKKISKDMTFGELMEQNPEMREKLMMMGLGCGGCPMAQMETIEGGAYVHGMDPEKLVKELNNAAQRTSQKE